MKIGVFDSGLGGLLVFKGLIKKLPRYDFVYLGDLKRLPYGNRRDETIYEFAKEATDYLFKKEDCQIIIFACNTASARALRRIQQEYLPKNFEDRRVLGVIIPTAEEAVQETKSEKRKTKNIKNDKKIGVLATMATVNSGTYKREILKLDPGAKVFEKSAPSLVTLIEKGETKFIEPILREYLKPLLLKKIDTLILGCTHYPIIKNIVSKIVGKKTKIISQDEIIPQKLIDYLKGHPEIENKLKKKGVRKILVTELTDEFQKTAKRWLGKDVDPKVINLQQ